MEIKEILKSKATQVLLGFIVVLGAISLAKFGYMFGQWLQQVIN